MSNNTTTHQETPRGYEGSIGGILGGLALAAMALTSQFNHKAPKAADQVACTQQAAAKNAPACKK